MKSKLPTGPSPGGPSSPNGRSRPGIGKSKGAFHFGWQKVAAVSIPRLERQSRYGKRGYPTH
jgi:hypothetical protein